MTHQEFVEQLELLGLKKQAPIVTLTSEAVSELVDDLVCQSDAGEVSWNSLSDEERQSRQLTSVITILRKIPAFMRQ